MKFSSIALASSLFAFAAIPGNAAEVEITLSHWVPPTHPLQVLGMEPWAKSISEASNGRIEIKIFPSQQLGAAPDHYDMARDGIVDIGFINPGYQPGRFPILAAGELPFMFANAKSGSRALHEWYQGYAKTEMKDVYVCMVHLHDPGTLHGKNGPLVVPGDLKGKNIRPPHATLARLVNSLGGASVQVPAPEIREALAKGAADITAAPWGSLFTFGLDSQVKHHLDMPLYATTFAFVMNKAKIDGLSPEDRAVMDDHCTPEWSEKMAAKWADVEAAGRQKIIDAGGHTLYKPTAEQVAEWEKATTPLLGQWKEAVKAAGQDPDAVYEAFIATLKKNGALVE